MQKTTHTYTVTHSTHHKLQVQKTTPTYTDTHRPQQNTPRCVRLLIPIILFKIHVNIYIYYHYAQCVCTWSVNHNVAHRSVNHNVAHRYVNHSVAPRSVNHNLAHRQACCGCRDQWYTKDRTDKQSVTFQPSAVTLTLNTTIQSLHKTLWLMMTYHQIENDQRLSRFG